MDGNYETKRYTADKLAFLGLFIAALLTARFIVSRHNQPFEAGSEIVAEIKNKGLVMLLADDDRQTFFLITNAASRTIGFTMDILTVKDPYTETFQSQSINSSNGQVASALNIQAVGFSYLRGRYAHEQATVFQSRSDIGEFIWKSEINTLAGRSGIELVLDKTGIMTVRKFGRRSEENFYRLSPSAIPDVLLGELFSQMLEAGKRKIAVDIIEADGTIRATVVSRIESDDGLVGEQDAEYIFRLEPLEGRGFFEQVYLDSQRQITKILLRRESIYIFERAGIEDILKEFPERADYILQKSKLLETK